MKKRNPYPSLSIAIYMLMLLVNALALWGQVPDTCDDVTNNELQKVLITNNLTNPMEFAISPDNRIFIVEKVTGNVKIVHLENSNISTALQIDVFSPAHEGLLGIALDPDFINNQYVYLYYTHPTVSRHELVRYTEQGGFLLENTKEVLLEVPGIRWNNQHHSSGSMVFGPYGHLYLATGENVDPGVSQGYASVNEADRMEDTQATSSNTNDLNGKILRIHPEDNGTYSIPDGNLFAQDVNTRGEIFAMGMRNPFRITIDNKTGWVYWGEPGPDATTANSTRGPAGRDEINRAQAPGFFGWPYFIAENLPYVVNGATQDPNAPVNNSPNNTGLNNLPAAQPSLIAYEDGTHGTYPDLGNEGGRASIMGAIYNYDPYQTSPHKLPPHYDGSLFIMDWSRDWIREVKLNNNGEVVDILPFLDHANPNGPIDMAIGPNGNMYILEYDANSLFHIQYTGSCRIDPTVSVEDKHSTPLYSFSKTNLIHLGQFQNLSLDPNSNTLQIFNLKGRLLWAKSIPPSSKRQRITFPDFLPKELSIIVQTSD